MTRVIVSRLVIFILSLALALAIAFGLASAARAEIRLRPAAVVAGPFVTLSDLLDGVAGDAGDAVVGPAPAPGEQHPVSVAAIARVAQRHGVAWQPPLGLRVVTVTRDGRKVPREAVAAAIKAALAKAGYGDGFAIQLTNSRAELVVTPEEAPSARVSDLTFDRPSGRFTATVAAPARGPASDSARVSGRAVAVAEVPVLRQRVLPGDVIDNDDIEWLAIPVERMNRQTVARGDDIVGLTPRRMLATGIPLRTSDLRRPELVAKGALVSIVYTAPGLLLATAGQALQSGGQGDLIQIMNMQTRRTVSAVVAGPNEVRALSQARLIGSGR